MKRRRLRSIAPILVLVMGAGLSSCQTATVPQHGSVATSGPGQVFDFDNRPEDAFVPTVDQTAFMDDLSRRTFDYFWQTTDAASCLAPDRWPSDPFSSIAATGFAIPSYAVGVERGYVTRTEAAQRTLNCMEFYAAAPQGDDPSGTTGHKGFFYHFLKHEDGTRFGTTELSSVDTALLFGGILFAQSYYDGTDAVETRIRELAERIYRRAEWPFFLRHLSGTQANNLDDSRGLAMGWKPGQGLGRADWVGYNEGMLIYILALASPTHPVTKEAWDKGWMARIDEDWEAYYGYEHLNFEPLFGHQYSHIFVDFRGIQDEFMRGKGIDYFENSRRATYSQKAYAQDNPQNWTGYGGDFWGLTASDGPGGGKMMVDGVERDFFRYRARGASAKRIVDDGTIVPTAAGGSIPFAPEITLPALMAMKAEYGDDLYTRYGFKDAYNLEFAKAGVASHKGQVVDESVWIGDDYLGIDQGPILLMLENHRSELIWRTLRKNPHIRKGLVELGFSGGWLDTPLGEAR